MALPIEVSVATEKDYERLLTIMMEAYKIEEGDTGVSFKKCPRFLNPEQEFLPDLREGKVLKAVIVHPTGEQETVGGISYCFQQDVDGSRRCHFGPFAVSPRSQGHGAGRALIDAVTDLAKQAGAASLDIEVVNWRTDLFPLYLDKMKFEVIGEAPFPAPERTTRPSHFLLMRKML